MATPPTYSAMNHSPQMVQICAPEQRLHLAVSVTTQPTVRKKTKCSFTPPSDVLDDRGGERARILHSRRSTDSTRWWFEIGLVVMGLRWTGTHNRGEEKVNIQVKHRYLKNSPESKHIDVHLNVLPLTIHSRSTPSYNNSDDPLPPFSGSISRRVPTLGWSKWKIKAVWGGHRADPSQVLSYQLSRGRPEVWLQRKRCLMCWAINLSQILAHTSAEQFTAYICLLGLAQQMARVRPGVVVEFAENLAVLELFYRGGLVSGHQQLTSSTKRSQIVVIKISPERRKPGCFSCHRAAKDIKEVYFVHL